MSSYYRDQLNSIFEETIKTINQIIEDEIYQFCIDIKISLAEYIKYGKTSLLFKDTDYVYTLTYKKYKKIIRINSSNGRINCQVEDNLTK